MVGTGTQSAPLMVPGAVFGNILLWLALIASLIAGLAYLKLMWSPQKPGSSSRKERGIQDRENLRQSARSFFYFSVAAIFFACATLMALILQHDFRLAYVAQYSSRRDPLIYVISSFWGGQEGTFLLWSLWLSLLCLVLVWTAKDYEAPAFFFANLLRIGLLLILIAKSPFATLPPENVPPEGSGLNPLLQNPWMAIHPPTLFLGFSACTIPFAYTMAALWRKDWDNWVKQVFPWTALAFTVLGIGIMLGGYWAYGVLGWGGWWGWDPVENGSLFPWLGIVALMHGLVMQRMRNTWVRANLALGVIPLIMVLYESWITRGGALEEFSVHSFAKEAGLYSWLLILMGFFTLLSIGMLAWRWRQIPHREDTPSYFSIPTAVYWGAFLIVIFTALLWVGTSSPILTKIGAEVRQKLPALSWLPAKAGKVANSYYNYTATPIGILLALLIGSVPLMSWRRTDPRLFLKKALIPIAVALLAGGIAYFWKVQRVGPLLLLMSGAFALTSSLIFLLKSPQKIGRLGAYVAHASVGLMLIGVVTADVYESQQRVPLIKDEPRSVFGYTVKYTGIHQPTPESKTALRLEVSDGKESFIASPRVYWSDYNQSYMYAPFIKKFPFFDLYISPAGPPQSTDDFNRQFVEMPVGSEQIINGIRFKFERFLASGMDPNRPVPTVRVAALIKVIRKGREEILKPAMEINMQTNQPQYWGDKTEDGAVKIDLTKVNPDTHTAELAIGGLAFGDLPGPPREIVQVEITVKPMINLVWLGSVGIFLGGLLSFLRRRSELVPVREALVPLGAKEKADPIRQGVKAPAKSRG